MSTADQPSYSAAIVTFRRPESLAGVLEALTTQTARPGLTVVVDNDPGESARAIVHAAEKHWPGRLKYVAAGGNLGPAGGWALAVEVAAGLPNDRGDWVLILDDDDPLTSDELVHQLLAQPELADHKIAGIGLRGALLRRGSARLRRVAPPDAHVADVEYLAGGGAPLYRWDAIDKLGFFVPELFFGFEDLEWGLRLRNAGYRLLVAPKPSLHVVADTAATRVPWREYYKTRSLIWILGRHVGRRNAFVAAARSIAGGVKIALQHRSLQLFLARALGVLDGAQGRLGVRRYHPAINPPKEQVVMDSTGAAEVV